MSFQEAVQKNSKNTFPRHFCIFAMMTMSVPHTLLDDTLLGDILVKLGFDEAPKATLGGLESDLQRLVHQDPL